MRVEELMTKGPRTVSPHDSLAVAAQRMWEGDCGALPVVDGGGIPIAMITDRDICMATWSRGLPPDRLRVEQAMSKALIVCSPADGLEEAATAMRLGRVRRLPVVDERRALVGIFSLADLARGQPATADKRAQAESAVAATLSFICQAPEEHDHTRAA